MCADFKIDNCHKQYKCMFFKKMEELTSKYGIDVIWFYGELGHGGGLVNAVSSCGYKA